MNITIRLTKVEVEMLKELQKKDKRYQNGLNQKAVKDIQRDYSFLVSKKWGLSARLFFLCGIHAAGLVNGVISVFFQANHLEVLRPDLHHRRLGGLHRDTYTNRPFLADYSILRIWGKDKKMDRKHVHLGFEFLSDSDIYCMVAVPLLSVCVRSAHNSSLLVIVVWTTLLGREQKLLPWNKGSDQ